MRTIIGRMIFIFIGNWLNQNRTFHNKINMPSKFEEFPQIGTKFIRNYILIENYWNFFGWNKSIWFQIGSINWFLFPIESIGLDLNYSLKPELIEISQWYVNFASCQRYPIKINHTCYVYSTHLLCTLHDFLNISIFRCFYSNQRPICRIFYFLQIISKKTSIDGIAVPCKNPWTFIYICTRTITISNQSSIYKRVKLYVW